MKTPSPSIRYRVLVLVAAAGLLSSCETAPYRQPVSPYTLYTAQEMRVLGQRYAGMNGEFGGRRR